MEKPFDNKAYQNEYHKAMKHKLVSFNPNDPEDMKLYQFLMSKGKGKVTAYIKSLIRKDMEKTEREAEKKAFQGYLTAQAKKAIDEGRLDLPEI